MPSCPLNGVAGLQSSFRNYTKLLICLLFSGLCVLFTISGIAESSEGSTSQSIEITIRLHPQLKRLELIDQVIVNRAAPKHRDTRLRRGELLVQCENEAHDNIGRLSIPDPSLIRSEWPGETGSIESPGLLRGEYIHPETAVFKIVVPWNDHFTYLRLSKFKKNILSKFSSAISYNATKALKTLITDDQLETIAFTRIDLSKNSTFRKFRQSKKTGLDKIEQRGQFND